MKKILNSKVGRLVAATVLAGGLIGGVALAANGAAVKPDCKNLMYPLCPRSVAEKQVVDNSIPARKLVPADREAFLKDENTPDVKGATTLKAVYNNKTVENVGGSWLTRKTELGSFTLPAGTWVINTSAKFNRTEADTTDPLYLTRPQFAVRALPTEANPFGLDFGTVMNSIAPFAGADMFGSDSKRVVLTEETTFTVAVFGYQDNRGSDDSGKIKLASATIYVAAG